MKKRLVIVTCAVVASVALWLTFFQTSEEEKIQSTLRELVQIVSVKESDTLLSRMARLRTRMKEVAEDDVRVNVAELGIDVRGRHKLEEEAAKAGLMFQSADSQLSSISIKIDPAGTLAQADAVALVTANRGGERKFDKRDVHFLLRKDGGWKISTMDVAVPKHE